MICYREANPDEAQMWEISVAARQELVQAVGERLSPGDHGGETADLG
jgi:hypothetical protein